METPGRIAATPDALDFTVENVEKVSFGIGQFLSAAYQLVAYSTGGVWTKEKWSCFRELERGKQRSLICLVASQYNKSYSTNYEIILLCLHTGIKLICPQICPD